MMEMVLRVVVYAASVWLSQKYADGYWVVGPAFGLAVAIFAWMSSKDRDAKKCVVFVAASTLIYALVYWLSRLDWRNNSDLFEYFLGPLPAGVITGSMLLPAAHARIFKTPHLLAAKTALGLIISFYIITLLGYLDDKVGFGMNIPWLSVMIAVWQGIYLYLFFIKRERDSDVVHV